MTDGELLTTLTGYFFGIRRALVDLGASKAALESPVIGAALDERLIAVEVKGFRPGFELVDLERAIGQYAIYKSWMQRTDPERMLYLAVSWQAYETIFQDESSRVLLMDYQIHLVVVDLAQERIVLWTE